jgi:hypothetical protein
MHRDHRAASDETASVTAPMSNPLPDASSARGDWDFPQLIGLLP